jgi:excisionase family DNA binding protein
MSARPPMTVKEAAEYLRVSTKTIYRLCERGLLRFSTKLRKKLISRDDVEKLGAPS